MRGHVVPGRHVRRLASYNLLLYTVIGAYKAPLQMPSPSSDLLYYQCSNFYLLHVPIDSRGRLLKFTVSQRAAVLNSMHTLTTILGFSAHFPLHAPTRQLVEIKYPLPESTPILYKAKVGPPLLVFQAPLFLAQTL